MWQILHKGKRCVCDKGKVGCPTDRVYLNEIVLSAPRYPICGMKSCRHWLHLMNDMNTHSNWLLRWYWGMRSLANIVTTMKMKSINHLSNGGHHHATHLLSTCRLLPWGRKRISARLCLYSWKGAWNGLQNDVDHGSLLSRLWHSLRIFGLGKLSGFSCIINHFDLPRSSLM